MTDLLDRPTIAEPVTDAPSKPRHDKTPQEVIYHSIHYIEEHGWVKEQQTDDYGRVCAIGAIAAVIYGGGALPPNDERVPLDRLFRETRDVVDRYVRSISMSSIPGIICYNDDKATTREDLFRVLRAAAESSQSHPDH